MGHTERLILRELGLTNNMSRDLLTGSPQSLSGTIFQEGKKERVYTRRKERGNTNYRSDRSKGSIFDTNIN